jgi:acetyl-CoA acyltransferase
MAAKKKSAQETPRGRRVVIVGGQRTPFVKAFAEFIKLDSIALGGKATAALLDKFNVSRSDIDAIVWGGVIFPPPPPTWRVKSRSTSSCRPASRA